jgi:hypothetical protein
VLSRSMIKPLAIALAVVGTLLLVLAIIYITMKASHLPSFIPGHLPERVTKKGHTIETHTLAKRGIVLILAAVAVFAATWWLAFRYEPAD